MPTLSAQNISSVQRGLVRPRTPHPYRVMGPSKSVNGDGTQQ